MLDEMAKIWSGNWNRLSIFYRILREKVPLFRRVYCNFGKKLE
jgi:hypothetical protein